MSSPLAGEPLVGRRLTARKIQGSVVDAPTVHFPLEHHLYGKTPTGIIVPTFTRAAPDAYEKWNGVWYPKGANEPRFQADSTPLGYLAEGSRTNYYLNSDAPVTQTISLGTGDFTLWLEGTGTITSSAGTATGTGYGAATEGSPNTINITGAGTVVFTLSGSATIAQVENGTTPSSFILTAGSAVTRAADVASMPTSNVWLVNDMCCTIEITPNSVDPAVNRVVLSTFTDSSNKLLMYYSGTQVVVQKRIAATNYIATVPFSYSANQPYNIGFRISSTTGVDVWANGTKGTGNANTTDAVIDTDFYIAQEQASATQDFTNHRNLRFYPELSDADLARLTT